MTPESNLEKQVLLSLSKGGVRLFRNSVALGWVGEFVGRDGDCTILRNARRNSFGLAVGSGDLIGWTIRNGVAVFTSLELKTPRGRIREGQMEWNDAVLRAGGLSGIVRTVEEAQSVVSQSALSGLG